MSKEKYVWLGVGYLIGSFFGVQQLMGVVSGIGRRSAV
jgi:hypothetical protein